MNNVISLDQLFHKRVFRVPDYQRGYSWEERQVLEFLEDLELLGSGRYHYTGTVILHASGHRSNQMDEEGNDYIPLDVVDGQQRLTTIVLLLDGIRRSLGNKAKPLSKGIKNKYISAKGINGQPLYKLTLNEDTDHFFKSNVLAEKGGVEGPRITSERRLLMAKKQIADYLEANIRTKGSAREDWLQCLYKKVATQLRFSLYEVEDEAEVGVIFEVMNDRGKPLTDLEKVKNYLLHTSTYLGISNELAKSVNGAWAEILRRLMAANLTSSGDEDRLLRAHWVAYYSYQVRNWEGAKSVKDTFDLKEYKDNSKYFLNLLHLYTEGLRASSISFCDAYQPNRPDAFESFKVNPTARTQVIEWSAKLGRVGVVVPFLPLLLAARDRWPADPNRYLELLKLCEALAFRVYRLMGSRANAGQSAFFRLGYDLAQKNEEFDGAIFRLKHELAYRCGDEDFQNEISAQEPGVWYGWRGLRYFLYEYEIALASKQGASPIVAWDELRNSNLQDTIEHILPRSIDNKPYWRKRFNREEHQRFLHDLGNLTLTKHNSHYQNKPFPVKKGAVDAKGPCYSNSPLYVERELTSWEDWNASAIDKRRGQLLEWACVRWAVDLSGLEDEDRAPQLIEEDEDSEAFVDVDEV